MATRQYIGARYVPKFVGDWDNTTAYEPLSIVLHNNASYTSKKQVPAGVLVTNTQYWVQTGSYNGFIQQLQHDIEVVDGKADDAKDAADAAKDEADIAVNQSMWHDKKVCVYGDSLSSEDNDEYWAYLTARDNTIQLTNRAVGGTTIDQTRNLIDSATDLATFDIIVIAHGTNEWQSSWGYNSIKYRFEATFNILKEKIASNPDCMVVIITPFYSYRNFGGTGTEANKAGMTIDMVNDAIAEVAYNYSYPVLNFYPLSSCNSSNYQTRLQDSSGIFVHEIGEFSEELSYIVERWDGTSYIPNKMSFACNMLSPIEFSEQSWQLTKAEYNAIPASMRDGICFCQIQNGASAYSLKRKLCKDEVYNIKFYSNNILACSVKNSTGTTVWMQVANANTEFKARFVPTADGEYYLYFNADPSVARTVVGGLVWCRADGCEVPQEWHPCEVGGATGSCSYKIDGDTLSFSSTSLTSMTAANILVMPLLHGIHDTFIPICGQSASSPSMTMGIIAGNGLQILRTAVGGVYMVSDVVKIKCYNFDI